MTDNRRQKTDDRGQSDERNNLSSDFRPLSSGSINILILEDNPSDAELIKLTLRKGGLDFKAQLAGDQETFLAALEQSIPDIILADYSLPGYDGLTATAQAREKFPDIPVVIVSGAIGEDLAIETLKAGATDYVLKTRLIRLTPVVKRALEETRQLAQKKQAEESLRQNRELLAVTLASIGDGVILTDIDGRITLLNREAERLTGWKNAQAGGKHLDLVFTIVNEQTRQTVESPVSKVLRHGAIVGLANHTLLIAKDGAEIPIDDSGAPIKAADGTVFGVVLVFRDFTERQKAERALQKAHDELEDKVRQRTMELDAKNLELHQRAQQLARLASELTLTEQRERHRLAQVLHDHLQQLLVGAKFGLDVLNRQTTDSKQKESISDVYDLIKESIAASRSLTIELSPPILHEAGLVAGLEWLTRWMGEKHGLTVELQAHDEVVVEREDVRILLFQSVRELLLNILKHAGVTSARVEICRRPDGNIEIVVSDEGAGFDPEALSKGAKEQTGFGLFSIRERLLLLGGKFKIESAPQNGAKFTLIAPAQYEKDVIEPPADTPPAAVELPDKSSKKTDDQKIRILMADDHTVMRQGLCALLQYEPDIDVVGQAADGQQAVEMARSLCPDIILMDFSMPRMNGVDATRIISSQLPQTRIIGLSMYEEADRANAMLDAGAVAYATKSGEIDKLLAMIRSASAIKIPPKNEKNSR